VAAIKMTPPFTSKPSISTAADEGLLTFVVTPAETGSAVATHGIDLVHEDDGGGVGLGLLEEVPHPAGTHAHKHLNKILNREIEKKGTRPLRPRPWPEGSFPCQEVRRGAPLWGSWRRSPGT